MNYSIISHRYWTFIIRLISQSSPRGVADARRHFFPRKTNPPECSGYLKPKKALKSKNKPDKDKKRKIRPYHPLFRTYMMNRTFQTSENLVFHAFRGHWHVEPHGDIHDHPFRPGPPPKSPLWIFFDILNQHAFKQKCWNRNVPEGSTWKNWRNENFDFPSYQTRS